jgi:hypothetical protein
MNRYNNNNSNTNDLEMGLYNNGYKKLKKHIQQQYYTSHSSKNKFTEINLYDNGEENECEHSEHSEHSEHDKSEYDSKKCCAAKNKARYFCNNICTIS